MRIKAIFIGIVFIIVGCGIKGPPLPPIEEKTVQELSQAHSPAVLVSGDETKQINKK